MKRFKFILLIWAALTTGSTAQANVFGLWVINAGMKVVRSHEVHKDVAYGALSHQELVVYPALSVEPSPVLVFIYGGGWNKGKKERYHFIADAMIQKGYTVVIPDYIKYPKGRFPAFVEDVALALRWTRDHISTYGGDPQKIVVAGHSAGAHTGALLMTDERFLAAVDLNTTDIRAFAGLAGPYEFTPEYPRYVKTFGQANFERMKASAHINGDEPPMLLLHSRSDKSVGQFNYDQVIMYM